MALIARLPASNAWNSFVRSIPFFRSTRIDLVTFVFFLHITRYQQTYFLRVHKHRELFLLLIGNQRRTLAGWKQIENLVSYEKESVRNSTGWLISLITVISGKRRCITCWMRSTKFLGVGWRRGNPQRIDVWRNVEGMACNPLLPVLPLRTLRRSPLLGTSPRHSLTQRRRVREDNGCTTSAARGGGLWFSPSVHHR